MAFVIVNYGENQKKIFNPNCLTKYLIKNIKQRCNYPNEIDVELSDEFGNLKNILKINEDQYASDVLNVERESLVLLQVKQVLYTNNRLGRMNSKPDQVTYIPLLKDDKIVTPKFTARLSNQDDTSSYKSDRFSKKGHSTKDKRGKDVKKSTDTDSHLSATPHPNTPNSTRRRNTFSHERVSASRSRSRGKQR